MKLLCRLFKLPQVLGHKTLSMVKYYAHLSDGHVSNVVASMNRKIFFGACDSGVLFGLWLCVTSKQR